jgi:hypothetical protein
MMKLPNMKRLRCGLWLPLTIVLLLTQCARRDSDSGADSSEPEKGERAADTRSIQPAPNQGEQLPGSVTTRDGGDHLPQEHQLPNESLNETTTPTDEPSKWEQEISALNQGMKKAITSGDTQSLIQNFNTAVKLYGNSPSSSSAVFGGLIPELDDNLDMARSLIDSMDSGEMMSTASAHSMALTIEDAEERNQWVQSLADTEVRDDVRQLLSGQQE